MWEEERIICLLNCLTDDTYIGTERCAVHGTSLVKRQVSLPDFSARFV